MQVATLFRESAKLLGASIDGGGTTAMDNSKYCMKPEAPADDGYETCLDAICGPPSDRYLGGGHTFNPGMRHVSPTLPVPCPPGTPNNNIENCRHPQPLYPPHANMRPNANHSSSPIKMDQYGNSGSVVGGIGDPYSFVDEMPNMDYLCDDNSSIANVNSCGNGGHQPSSQQPKKRGRRKKSDPKSSHFNEQPSGKAGDEKVDARKRKLQDRFNGLTEEEVARRTLPDHLAPNLDIIIVGINPGMFAAYKGHHYAGPGNHFWKCLYLAGLVPEAFAAEEDFNMINYGIGFTNMVARPTKGSADLTRREIKQGSQILLEKLQKYQPKIAVFNGKLIYEVFSGKKDFPFGRQSEFVEGTNTYIWVMPSSSARCAQLPRAADKVPFYMALKKFRDYLNGLISDIDESEVVFHEPKNSNKAIANSPNSGSGELKNSVGKYDSKALLSPSDRDSLLSTPVKKKRGRPRKGMEKNGEFKVGKMSKHVNDNRDDESFGGGEPQRKRRGRPKKVKNADGSLPPISKMSSSSSSAHPMGRGDVNGYDRTISSVAMGISSTPTGLPKASSVSSGYSTGTNSTGSASDRRGDENGSNAGSNGLSPSHHSFTTQSDLSSEISAAISCGSCPPSPLNNNNGHAAINGNVSNNSQTDTVFDGLPHLANPMTSNSNHQSRSHHKNVDFGIHHGGGKQAAGTLHGGGGNGGADAPPSINFNNLYHSPGVSSSSSGIPLESHASYSQPQQPQYPSQYNSRYHPQHLSQQQAQQQLGNRSHSYNLSPKSSNSNEESVQTMQYQRQHQAQLPQQHHTQQPQHHQQRSYDQNQKPLDITTKSLSGLESLVDQIPSIGDGEIPGVGAGSLGADSGAVNNPNSLPLVSSSTLPLPISSSGSSSHISSSLSSHTHSSGTTTSHFGDSSSTGFLPYSHHHVPSSPYSSSASAAAAAAAAAAATHYHSPSYYPSELGSGFPVNSLSSPYSSSHSLFGYPSYHSQYHSGVGVGMGVPGASSSGDWGGASTPTTTSSLHHLSSPSPYANPGNPYGSPSPYPGTNPYMQGHPHSMAAAAAAAAAASSQRYTQRGFQGGMDFGSLGFGGF